MIGSGDELLQVGQPVGFGIGKDQLRLDVRFAGLLARHLRVATRSEGEW